LPDSSKYCRISGTTATDYIPSKVTYSFLSTVTVRPLQYIQNIQHKYASTLSHDLN